MSLVGRLESIAVDYSECPFLPLELEVRNRQTLSVKSDSDFHK
jgi:hypothetical protein